MNSSNPPQRSRFQNYPSLGVSDLHEFSTAREEKDIATIIIRFAGINQNLQVSINSKKTLADLKQRLAEKLGISMEKLHIKTSHEYETIWPDSAPVSCLIGMGEVFVINEDQKPKRAPPPLSAHYPIAYREISSERVGSLSGKVVESRTVSMDAIKACQSEGFKLVTKKGNADKYGTILLFGQFHEAIGIRKSFIVRQVKNSQVSILNTLLRLGPEHVFLESSVSDVVKPERMLVHAKHVFNRYKAGHNLTVTQKDLVTTYGAGVIYAALNDKVILHGTSSMDAYSLTKDYVESPENYSRLRRGDLSKWTDQDREVIIHARERLAMKTIERLSIECTQPVALIFGLMHNFSCVLDQGEFLPQVYRKDFGEV